jgi:putative acetyltransferase
MGLPDAVAVAVANPRPAGSACRRAWEDSHLFDRSPPMSPITIRRTTPKDAAAMARIMGDPEVLPNLMQLPYTSTEIWEQRLTENDAPGKTHLSICAERDGVLVGSAGLHPVAAIRRRHVGQLGISVAREAQGQGVGKALMKALCDYADDWAQLLRIELTVFADNERAIALYRQFGFQHEGTLRAYALRKGAYVDTLAMARLHPNPPQLPAAN